MNSKDYKKAAIRTDRSDEGYVEHSRTYTGSKGRLINGALGLAGECGEIVDIIKKHTQFNKELNTQELKEELGDLMWYVAIILQDINSDFDEIMAINEQKLRLRFPNSFSEEQALERKDKSI